MNALAPLALGVALWCAGLALTPRRARSMTHERTPRHPRLPTRPRARSAAIDLHYADAIELIVLAVRAGHLPLSAIRAVHHHMAPAVGDAFADVVARCDRGERFADSLAELPRRLGTRAHTLADGLSAADRDGLPLAPVLDRLADDARQQRRRRADASARQLPVRLSVPLVLCTLPSFVLLAVAPLLLAAVTSLRR
ncbi:MAG: type II secretion system F family protein [Actinobacteria bacterium]|nr:type II secretion system F family protein [Actinomycetota bacterium]